jgi:hypothetical protein
MQPKYDTLHPNEQDSRQVSQEIVQELEIFLAPLFIILDTPLDKRLVRTFLQVCVAILRFRSQKQGLLLSELGAYLVPDGGKTISAAAGTKRISNLLRSIKWSHLSLDHFLLKEADKGVKHLQQQGKPVLCIWDGSVLEKPESWQRSLLAMSLKTPGITARQKRNLQKHNKPCRERNVGAIDGRKPSKSSLVCIARYVTNVLTICTSIHVG